MSKGLVVSSPQPYSSATSAASGVASLTPVADSARQGSLVDLTVYLVVRLAVCFVQALRLETCETLARGLAIIAADVLCLRSRVVHENLQQVFPEMSLQQRQRIIRRMWAHLILMACEIMHAPRKIHRQNWHQHVTIDQKRTFVRYLLDPRPTLIVSGHFGNFEMGGYITGLLGFPTFTVARTLDNPYLDRYVNRFRAANGQYIVDKDGSAIQLDRILAAGDTLSLLGDQHAGPKGVWVDFCGRPASCHKAIALFTLTSRAPMLVAYSLRAGRPLHFQVGLSGLVDPEALPDELSGVKPLTQWYNARLETMIRSAPEQYWWLHRRWKEPPPGRRGMKTVAVSEERKSA